MKMLLGGRWCDREDRIEIRDPSDGGLIDSVPRATSDDMRQAVTFACEAAPAARRATTLERKRLLQGAADRVAAGSEDFATLLAREGIKTLREARAEVGRAVTTLELAAEEATRLRGETIAFDQAEGGAGRVGYYERVPRGVIGAITPFNDPLNLVAHKVGPAVAAGNCIIVKPHEATPLVALRLAEAFCAAGMEVPLLQVVTGTGEEAGGALVSDPRVAMISFSGGGETGRKIAAAAGIKKLTLELGSNSAVIVMPDADLDAAVGAILGGAFAAAGQNCLHVQRILLHEKIYWRFLDDFLARAAALKVGDKLAPDTDVGPLIDERAALRVEGWVEEAVAAGGRLLAGGQRQGTFYPPTVLEEVPASWPRLGEEVFGPVTVCSPFVELEAAISEANRFATLHAAIFTSDLRTALHAAEELQGGAVIINDSTDYRLDAMPFGGLGGSGFGREGVRFAIEEMTEPKVVCFRLG